MNPTPAVKGRRLGGPVSTALTGVCALLLSGAVSAQQQLSVSSDALDCLLPVLSERQPVDYPALRLQRKEGASFEVDFLFDGADRAPRVKLVKETRPGWVEPEADFLEAVEAYARQLRVPCLTPAQGSASLRQRFNFEPNDGRKVANSLFSDSPGWRSALPEGCTVQHAALPSYPMAALRREVQGSVIMEYRFDSATAAPRARIVTQPVGSPEFGRGLMANVRNLSLPCFNGEPVTLRLLYVYRLQDARRTLLRDMDLRQFLGAAQDVPQPAYFDLNTLGCPFSVRVKYTAPYIGNTIKELDSSVSARKPFLDWLSRIALKLPERAANLVIGDEFTLDIPCVKVDL